MTANPDRPEFTGTFDGAGAWYDSAGKSATYRIHQSNAATTEGFEVAFKHDFDDGSVVEARFTMNWIAPNLFRVDVSGAAVGHGYIFDGVCHYHMKFGDKFVEVSYHAAASGLEVFGSSSSNAEGNYVAWRESLHRGATSNP